MCGQAGVVRMGKKPIPVDLLSLLLVGNEKRGSDATGIAIAQDNGDINVLKNDEQAWRFCAGDQYKSFIKDHVNEQTWAVILHTRAATRGNPRFNKNNHPLTAGKGVIVHNGIISNDDRLFKDLRMERSAETDSDILRAYVDKYGLTEEAITEMNHIAGSAAGSALHPDYPHKVLLFRSGSPMCLASNDDLLVWSSEKTTIHRAMRPWIKRYGIYFQEQRPEIAFSPFPDDTAWIIGPKGLEYHGKFKTLGYTYTEPHRKVYEGYSSRQTKWDNDAKREIETTNKAGDTPKADTPEQDWSVDCVCSDFPKCKREWLIPKGGDPHNFYCNTKRGGCGKRLQFKESIAVN